MLIASESALPGCPSAKVPKSPTVCLPDPALIDPSIFTHLTSPHLTSSPHASHRIPSHLLHLRPARPFSPASLVRRSRAASSASGTQVVPCCPWVPSTPGHVVPQPASFHACGDAAATRQTPSVAPTSPVFNFSRNHIRNRPCCHPGSSASKPHARRAASWPAIGRVTAETVQRSSAGTLQASLTQRDGLAATPKHDVRRSH